jgi:hypothetical protein
MKPQSVWTIGFNDCVAAQIEKTGDLTTLQKADL